MTLAKKIKIGCIGDSLTAGSESADYPALLQQHLGNSVSIHNAGQNGATTASILKGLDKATHLNLDVVIVLLGTNDVFFTHDPRMKWVARFRGKSDVGSFEQNLHEIAHAFVAAGIKVFLVSPPPFGENPGHELNLELAHYIESIKGIAEKLECKYIPFNQEIWNRLNTIERTRSEAKPADTWLSYKALFKKRILKRSWNQIADEAGLLFTVDGIHLNERGTNILVDLIVSALNEFNLYEMS